MSTIAGMKLVASKKNRTLSPIQQRRNKLAAKIHEQWGNPPIFNGRLK
jgi:hypothetical protein